MPIIPSHRAAGQSADGNEGDGGWGTGARAPRRATSNGPEATRISGSNFQISPLDTSIGILVSFCLGSARDWEQVGIRLGKGRGTQGGETQEALGFY